MVLSLLAIIRTKTVISMNCHKTQDMRHHQKYHRRNLQVKQLYQYTVLPRNVQEQKNINKALELLAKDLNISSLLD